MLAAGGRSASSPTAQVEVSSFVAGMVALGLVFAAYASEVFLGALPRHRRGQYEAAYALGLRPLPTFAWSSCRSSFAWRCPGLANLWLVLLKDTSLVSVIALNDLMRETYGRRRQRPSSPSSSISSPA